MESLELLRSLFEDLRRQHPAHRRHLDRDFLTIQERTKNEGFAFLAQTLPRFGDWLFACLETGSISKLEGFSFHKGLPRLFAGFLKEIFDTTGKTKTADLTMYVADLRQILYVFKKVSSSTKH